MSTLQDAKLGLETPKGAKRFGWHSYAWLGWGAAFFAVESHALYKNHRGGREDYQHRTLTENVRWLAATDRDGLVARFGRFRRVALIGSLGWLVIHFLTDGEYV